MVTLGLYSYKQHCKLIQSINRILYNMTLVVFMGAYFSNNIR